MNNLPIYVGIGFIILTIALFIYIVVKKFTRKDSASIIYFYLPGCQFCTEFNPTWAALQERYKDEDIRFGKVQLNNPGYDQGLIDRFAITSAPTLLINGEMVYKGPRTLDAISASLNASMS